MEACAVSREISHNKGIRCASTPCRLPHRSQNNPNQPFMIYFPTPATHTLTHPHNLHPKTNTPDPRKKESAPDRLCRWLLGLGPAPVAFCVMSGLRRLSGSAPFQLLPLLFLFIWWSKCGFRQVNRPELEQQQAGWGCLARPQTEVEKPPVTASSQNKRDGARKKFIHV